MNGLKKISYLFNYKLSFNDLIGKKYHSVRQSLQKGPQPNNIPIPNNLIERSNLFFCK